MNQTLKIRLISPGYNDEVFIEKGTTVAEAFRQAGLEIPWATSTAQNRDTGVNIPSTMPITEDGVTIAVSKVTTGN